LLRQFDRREGHVAVCEKEAEYRIDQGGLLGNKRFLPGTVCDEHMLQAVNTLYLCGFSVHPVYLFIRI